MGLTESVYLNENEASGVRRTVCHWALDVHKSPHYMNLKKNVYNAPINQSRLNFIYVTMVAVHGEDDYHFITLNWSIAYLMNLAQEDSRCTA